MHAPRELPVIAADILARVRARRPRVHCITNAVAQQFTANMLLAANAVPSMTTDPAEVAEFVARADALLVNLGTLAARRPRAIRLNRAEFATLAGVAAGADAGGEALARYAQRQGTVIGLTGDRDSVTDGKRTVAIANGDPLMAKVTAMGCAASALVAACLATAAGLILIGVAGEVAALVAHGPGTFAAAIIDALHGLDEATILARARLAI